MGLLVDRQVRIKSGRFTTGVKLAVQLLFAFMRAEPVAHSEALGPVQPVKVEPAFGVAVSMTDVPESNGALQVDPQLIPGGLEVTVPLPVPALVTVNAY